MFALLSNRVHAVGRDSYLRLYPNPGFGVCFGPRRLAVSWRGGIEWFRRHPRLTWVRTWSLFSRVRRPQ